MGAIRRTLAVAVAAVALATACGGSADGAQTTPRPQEASPGEPGTDPTTSPDAEVVGSAAVVARSDGEVDVHPEPGTAASHTLAATTSFGSERALLVVDTRDGWLEVALPERPNGTTGWVRTEAVELSTLDHAIEIDLATRTLSLFEGGDLVTSTPVAVGTPENPTPTGDFYVVDKLASEDPDGPYGPFAFGLSAYSETLTEFGGGDGQVGIHGTDDPSTIGRDVSHGCVRVSNEVAEMLNETLYLGTPVTIT